MALDFLLDRCDELPATRALLGRLPAAGARVGVAGLPGSSAAVLLAAVARALPHRVFAVVAPTPADAERWHADLRALAGDVAALYPQREALGAEEPHVEIAGERVETVAALLRGPGAVRILVTTARATAELTAVPAALAATRLELASSLDPGVAGLRGTVERLAAMGYARVPLVVEVGQFSVRGGILDVYGYGMAAPARIEWWGDEVASLRSFDLDTQRSGDAVARVTVLPMTAERPAGSAGGRTERQSLLALLPADAVVLLDQEAAIAHEVERAWADAAHHLEIARRLGEDPPAREALFLDPRGWTALLGTLGRVALDAGDATDQFAIRPPESIDRDLRRLRRLVADPAGPPTVILCDNEGQLERLEELLDGAPAQLVVGALDGGFVLPRLRVLTDHEIFRRARRLRRARRYRSAAPAAVGGAGAAALAAGDYVVHLEHGIGVYRGLQTIVVGDAALEVAVVEYEGGDRLNVPVYRLDQLEPFRTDGDGDAPPPRLHRLGSTAWQRQRDKTRAAIQLLAHELVDLYARRQLAPGYAFPADTPWQRELESSFLYEDTRDQRRATDEVKRDLERARPMDRLLVGDVGYGKTEIAVRAAFKAVQSGKQVAVLVPTTILAEQHGRTFRERLADYPVRVEVLSRFRTPAESAAIARHITAGDVDVVIGTHRLLSRDVAFHDLGLLVVDEEHRFGVRHKERLKALKLAVDVLTLTATPIPRTLHLSLAGLRDLTLLETAPKDRSPVLTFVEPWDDALLEEAMARELDRGGQVYFVHNRIETIAAIAQRVRRLAPRARVEVAHGQMKEAALDGVMARFVSGDVHVLVSTMIVESGLDVPNANTMIVDRADRLGLAQLYQLRGRVGRSHRRAYCYLLVPDLLDANAEERLRVLEHHSDLGAGYRIAQRDLEIRGAGNLLGREQSGHAHAVGFDMYLRWLHETVEALKDERGTGSGPFPAPDVVLDLPAHLPESYVASDAAKLDLYRRLARAQGPCEIADIRDELRDRFGPLPPEAERLVLVADLRALGAAAGVETILVRGDEARVQFRREARPVLARLGTAFDAVQLEAEVRRTTPLALRLRRLGGEPVGDGVRRALLALAEPAAVAAPAGGGTGR
jgi:transcription-repair coupling factor (superfamily II helicase)